MAKRKILLAAGGILIFSAVFLSSAATVRPLLQPTDVWRANAGPAPNAEVFAEETRIALGGNEAVSAPEEEVSATTTTLAPDPGSETSGGTGSEAADNTGSDAAGDAGSAPSDEEFYKDWKPYENQGMGVSLKLPAEFHVDHEYDNDAAFLNYDPQSAPEGQDLSRGNVRINLFTMMNKESGEDIEEYLKKNVTSSSKNVVRADTEVDGRAVLVETGVDGAPYETFYFDAGSRLVALVILGSPEDYEANKLLLAAVAYSVRIRE